MGTTDMFGNSRYRPTGYPSVAKELPLQAVGKPKIKKEFPLGWTCRSDDSWGYGDSPAGAYVMWADGLAMEKINEERGRIERANKRQMASKYWNGDYANEP